MAQEPNFSWQGIPLGGGQFFGGGSIYTPPQGLNWNDPIVRLDLIQQTSANYAAEAVAAGSKKVASVASQTVGGIAQGVQNLDNLGAQITGAPAAAAEATGNLADLGKSGVLIAGIGGLIALAFLFTRSKK
jgi:hypothetical protein